MKNVCELTVAIAQLKRNIETKMETSVIFLMILTSAAAMNGNARETRDLHPDDKKTIDEIRKQLNNLQKSLQNRHCNNTAEIMEKIGSVYTRWGRSTCPKETQLVYNGRAAGSLYSHTGGAANTLCLPLKPQWDKKVKGNQYASTQIYGAEYETNFPNSPYKQNHNYEIPCAVCRTKGRPNVYMMPARTKCEKGWKVEYRGYLMAGHHTHQSATEYVCMDKGAKTVGDKTDSNGRVFYSVEAQCGSLPCGPYIAGGELTCVVCSM